MERRQCEHSLPKRAGRPAVCATQAGIALLEVLIAILMMGVGLLALLTLFPLGMLEMAQAIPDDRTAAANRNAMAFSQAGVELISETTDFVTVSLSTGSIDSGTVARLREQYQQLTVRTEDLEVELEELRYAFPREQIQPYLSPLLAQVRSIKQRIAALAHLLSLLDETGEDSR